MLFPSSSRVILSILAVIIACATIADYYLEWNKQSAIINIDNQVSDGQIKEASEQTQPSNTQSVQNGQPEAMAEHGLPSGEAGITLY